MVTSIAYIIFLALALGYIFTKLRLPALLGMIISGIILGPYALDLIDPKLLNISIELRQIALVIILLRAGLSLDINDLRKVGRPAVLMCFVPACFEIAAMVIFAPMLLGITTLDAAIMGTVVAAVSPAVIVPKMISLMEQGYGTKKGIPQMIMAGGSVDDVFVIVMFAAFTSLAQGGQIEVMSFVNIPISIITGIILGCSVGYLLSQYFKRFHLRDTVKLLILISSAFLLLQIETWLKTRIPISGLLGVMAMGIMTLKQHPVLAKRISPKFSKLWVAAEIILFVMVGATVNIKYALDAGTNAIILLFAVMAIRMLGVFVSMIATPLNTRERLFCMIAYLPKATVQAAIGSLPLAMGLGCGEIVLTVAVLSILISAPLGALGIDSTYRRLLTR